MKIKWYGTASLLIEGGNTRILIDPYLKKYNPALPRLPVEEAAQADAVFITHPHLDHFSDIGTFLDAGIKKVYVSQNGMDNAAAFGISTDCMYPLSPNERITVGDITVRTYQSRHCQFDALTVLSKLFSPKTLFRSKNCRELQRLNKKFPVTDDIYALEFTRGEKRIMVLGSAGMDEDTEYPQGADLLVFPYQGRKGMHKHIVPFLEKFLPKAVMIDHFDDAFPPISRSVNTKKFANAVYGTLHEAEAFVPKENIWYKV